MAFTFIDLFAGIGGFHEAASRLGGQCVFASEIDEFAAEAYSANYGVNPHGDITQIPASQIPDHDVLFAGFPCQPFSIIGKQHGFEDARGTLFFDIVRILEEKKPAFLILENVKQLATHDSGKTISTITGALETLGYSVHWKVLNALDYGLPQKRERTVIVGFLDSQTVFQFPKPIPMIPLTELLEAENTIGKKYYASDRITNKRLASHTANVSPGIWHENKSGHISSYPYSCALRAGASYNYLLVDGKRRLTPREMLRLQGFPDSFDITCSDMQTRKQAGNAVPVNLIEAVLKEAINATKAAT